MATTGSLESRPQTAPTIVAARSDRAWISLEGKIVSVAPGDDVVGLGRISAIVPQDGGWALLDDKGTALLRLAGPASGAPLFSRRASDLPVTAARAFSRGRAGAGRAGRRAHWPGRRVRSPARALAGVDGQDDGARRKRAIARSADLRSGRVGSPALAQRRRRRFPLPTRCRAPAGRDDAGRVLRRAARRPNSSPVPSAPRRRRPALARCPRWRRGLAGARGHAPRRLLARDGE